MAEKFKKIDKPYKLTDDSVNCYGFRLLTAGYLIDEYKKNPIGYNMHLRDNGVVVRWEDFEIKGDAVWAKPVINLSNARGQQTVDEIENGFLNAASLGHFVVLETSDDPALKMPNQTGPTVTKWFNRECSLVDIPGNFNSLKLYDKDDNEINLSDFSKQNFSSMKQIFLTAEQIGKLNLKAETADAAAVDAAFNNLLAEAAKVPQLLQDLAAAKIEKKTAEDALSTLKESIENKAVEELIAKGVDEKKFTVQVGNQLKDDYAGNSTGLKALVDAMPVYAGIVKSLENAASNDRLADLMAKTWDELDKEGSLEELKALDLEGLKAKYKERFGKDWKQ
jgi:hypothetical protein